MPNLILDVDSARAVELDDAVRSLLSSDAGDEIETITELALLGREMIVQHGPAITVIPLTPDDTFVSDTDVVMVHLSLPSRGMFCGVSALLRPENRPFSGCVGAEDVAETLIDLIETAHREAGRIKTAVV